MGPHHSRVVGLSGGVAMWDVLVLVLQWGCLGFLAFGAALSLLGPAGNFPVAKITSAVSVAPASEADTALSERRKQRRLKKAA